MHHPCPSPDCSSSGNSDARAEATKGDVGDDEDVDAKIARALECPCVDDLKSGPCGPPFVDAFTCYAKSTEPEKVRSSLWSVFSRSDHIALVLGV